MTKLKFYLNLGFVLLLFVFTAIVSGNSIRLYLDIASLILGILVPYIIISFIYPPSEQSALLNAVFKSGEDHDESQLKRALAYLKSFTKLLIYSGIIWTLMGAIGIGAHLEGPEALGLNFGVLMIVPLYVSLFLIIVVEPLRASAQKKLV